MLIENKVVAGLKSFERYLHTQEEIDRRRQLASLCSERIVKGCQLVEGALEGVNWNNCCLYDSKFGLVDMLYDHGYTDGEIDIIMDSWTDILWEIGK